MSISEGENDNKISLVKIDKNNLGCDAWLACFGVNGSKEKYIIEVVSQPGNYLLHDGENLKKGKI